MLSCVFSSTVLQSTLKKAFPEAHIDFAKGTAVQCRDYVRKEGIYAASDKKSTNRPKTFEEWGTMPTEKRGKRTDLEFAYNMICEGKTIYEIFEEKPSLLRYVDKLEYAQQIVRTVQNKTKMRKLNVHYIFGETGTGKTHDVMKNTTARMSVR